MASNAELCGAVFCVRTSDWLEVLFNTASGTDQHHMGVNLGIAGHVTSLANCVFGRILYKLRPVNPAAL